MKIRIEVDEAKLKSLVFEYLSRALGDVPLDPKDIRIETKSKQNYRAEWEGGAGFRATVEKDVA